MHVDTVVSDWRHQHSPLQLPSGYEEGTEAAHPSLLYLSSAAGSCSHHPCDNIFHEAKPWGKGKENHWPWHQQASETTWAALYVEASTNMSLALLSISQVSYYFQTRAFFRNTLQLHFTTEETEAQTVQLTWPEEGSSPNLSDSKSGVFFLSSQEPRKEVWARERCGRKFLARHLASWNKRLFSRILCNWLWPYD